MFRFQNLEIWKTAADIAVDLDLIASTLEEKRLYRYADQLRGAALSISNNIAEGSGSDSVADFRRFLSYAKKSSFECASMLCVFVRRAICPRPKRKGSLSDWTSTVVKPSHFRKASNKKARPK